MICLFCVQCCPLCRRCACVVFEPFLMVLLHSLIMERHGADENFIHMVVKYPFLYDKREKSFKNSQLKTQTWTKIGTTFGITGDEATKYFKSLREKYLRLKREAAKYERSGAAAYYKEKWHLYDLLTFLDDVSQPRKTISNIMQTATHQESSSSGSSCETTDTQNSLDFQESSQEDTSSATEEITIEVESGITDELLQDNLLSPIIGVNKRAMKTPSTPPGIKKKQKLEDKLSRTLDSIASSLTQTQEVQPNDCYVQAFCKHIEQEMLKMPSDIVEDFKDEVMELLLQKRRQLRLRRDIR